MISQLSPDARSWPLAPDVKCAYVAHGAAAQPVQCYGAPGVLQLANLHCNRNHLILGAPRCGKTLLARHLVACFAEDYAPGGVVFTEDDAWASGAGGGNNADYYTLPEFDSTVIESVFDTQRVMLCKTRPVVVDDLMYVNKCAEDIATAMLQARWHNVSFIVATTYDFDENLAHHADFIYLMRNATDANLRRVYDLIAEYFIESFDAFLAAFFAVVRRQGDCLVIEVATRRLYAYNATGSVSWP